MLPVEVTVPDGDCGEAESLDDALEAGGVVPDTHCDVEGGGTPTASDIWLEACSSVRYEERGDIQGVRYSTDDGKEGWTPIEISRKAFQGRRSNSDGSKNNPKISEAAKIPKLHWAKEVSYHVIDGTPGLRFRNGPTLHSYTWIPVISSPIASRTRSRLKTGI